MSKWFDGIWGRPKRWEGKEGRVGIERHKFKEVNVYEKEKKKRENGLRGTS